MGDVARRVGVSRQLVGLAFGNGTGVSATTRERILRAAEDLGYRPDVAARSLRQRSSDCLGVVFSPIHGAEVDVVDELYPAAQAAGYHIVLSLLTSTRDHSAAIDEALGYRCAALILIGLSINGDELRRLSRQLPVVVVGGDHAEPTGCDYVLSAGDKGVADTVDHLFAMGHRDIAYVHGERMASARLRHAGYLGATGRLALPNRTIVVHDDYIEESGSSAAGVLLHEPHFPTAIVAGNDHAALGLIHTLLRAGVRVPEDVSVTGFDDSRISQLSYVKLTTVHQDGRELAHAAVAAAVGRIAGREEGIETLIMPRLVVRQTSGPPRSASPRTTSGPSAWFAIDPPLTPTR